MKRTLSLILFIACGLYVGEAGTIPPELVGVWAPASAKLSGGVPSEGYAIYINTDGLAAVVKAPPPIGERWIASYAATNHMLSLREPMLTKGLTQVITNHFVYDPKAKTFTTISASTTEVLYHHGSRIPEGVIEDLQ